MNSSISSQTNTIYEETTVRVRVNKELYKQLKELMTQMGDISLNELLKIMYEDYVTKGVIEYSCYQSEGCSQNCPCVYNIYYQQMCQCSSTCWCKQLSSKDNQK